MSWEIRLMEPRDVPKLIALQEAQHERDGTHYPLPRFFSEDGKLNPNIALALTVFENGVLRQAVYFVTKAVEMCFVGCDPKASIQVKRDASWVLGALHSLGFDAVHCFVPNHLAGDLARGLFQAGFSAKPEFTHFYQELD